MSHPGVPGRGTSGLAPSSAYTPAARANPKDYRAGTFKGGAPDTVRNASFYADKRKLEATLGRELTIEEYRLASSDSAAARSYDINEWVRDKIEDGDIAGGLSSGQSGTSIFDPVLCELAYRWFSPPGGVVVDPFAGGSVRGIVASHLGREYHGVELRAEQVAANQAQAALAKQPAPHWYQGDSVNLGDIAPVKADFVFSCPPYGDLERYSDDPRDLSAMDYPEFLTAYRAIIAACGGILKPDRFACFVVGDIRDKKGNYRNFVGDTVEAFRAAGMHFYNEAILITAVGSLPIRVNRQFQTGRKLGKTHQNILVFVKGDGKKAAAACGVEKALEAAE